MLFLRKEEAVANRLKMAEVQATLLHPPSGPILGATFHWPLPNQLRWGRGIQSPRPTGAAPPQGGRWAGGRVRGRKPLRETVTGLANRKSRRKAEISQLALLEGCPHGALASEFAHSHSPRRPRGYNPRACLRQGSDPNPWAGGIIPSAQTVPAAGVPDITRRVAHDGTDCQAARRGRAGLSAFLAGNRETRDGGY